MENLETVTITVDTKSGEVKIASNNMVALGTASYFLVKMVFDELPEKHKEDYKDMINDIFKGN